jgi:hypothetical protein
MGILVDEVQQLGIPGTVQLWFLPDKEKYSMRFPSGAIFNNGANSIGEEAKI